MASKRMFAQAITESDRFVSMPISAHALYFHLGMRADNEGIYDAPQQLIQSLRVGQEDMRILVQMGYVIPVETGYERVIVIRDWFTNNDTRIANAKSAQSKYHSILASSGIILDDGQYNIIGNSTELHSDSLETTTELHSNSLENTALEQNSADEISEEQKQEDMHILSSMGNVDIVDNSGIPNSLLRKLENEFGKDAVVAKLRLLSSQKNVINPAGWLTEALKKDYQ